MTGDIVVISVASMGGIGAALSLFLAYADKKFKVEEDPRIEGVLQILPNSNCGGCGQAGCRMFAEAVLVGKVPITGCVAGGQAVVDGLAKLLGVEAQKANKIVAVVLCHGGEKEALKTGIYKGEKTCVAANFTSGEKACSYSCIGYGDCVEACKWDAMAMNDNGLPVVFHDACIGCGACARACPRFIIEMHPIEHKLFNYCRNKDKGAVARKVCKVSCVACTLCVKDCPQEGGIDMIENLAVLNYEKCLQDTDAPIKRCPTKCLLYGEEEKMTKAFYYASLKKPAA
ncbi:MAG: RnfABCDGE type electron transport complex subunit B [Deltaproteobacteria bacterium]|nr:RnfABCDGE type electron transport complex subunit B [Deltaproteobacteria bacterium]